MTCLNSRQKSHLKNPSVLPNSSQRLKSFHRHGMPVLCYRQDMQDILTCMIRFSGHPSFPDKPPFETAVALLAAPIDKLRDLFVTFPDDA